jgi:hypothetical protein
MTRVPFDAMVEVGGTLGPTFEAQAVNLSEEGMHLRTAYLPEIGQPITCRFDAGHGQVIVAAGEVLWNEDMGDGGEFGVRFTNLDAASATALNRILGMGGEDDGTMMPGGPRAALGRKVRLHIDGLASPMRARVKDANDTCVKAFSELGFLEVGKGLEVEDAATGSRRPAQIDGVAVELEPASRIPQLVVSLRYDTAEARAGYASAGPTVLEAPPAPAVDHDAGDAGEVAAHAPASLGSPSGHGAPMVHAHDAHEDDHDAHELEPHHASVASAAPSPPCDDLDEESAKLKGPIARTAAKITPALESWAKRAKTTVALLAARRKGGTGDDVAIPVRRTTAPAPGGGLHASGRKVVRGSASDDVRSEDTAMAAPAGLAGKITKKRAAVAGAIGVAAILGIFAMRKPAPAPAALVEGEGAQTTTTAAAGDAPLSPAAPISPAALPGAPAASPHGPAPVPPPGSPQAPPPDGAMASSDATSSDGKTPKNLKVTPFGNGPVGSHGTVLKLKMDGAIEKIHGASQPTGFTVVLPNRKSLDAAGPLAAKDPRIAAIKVSNESGGAELSVTFKDGVPNYLVRAKGDSLELVLARSPHATDKPAAAQAKPGKKHGKKH